jgi:Skp family chaperone for outer membrane proteins
MLMSTWKSPVALYQALMEANVSKETAATAAQSVVEDIGSVVANMATKQDIQQGLDTLEASVDSKLTKLESKMNSKLSNIDARFKVQNIYLAIIAVIAASSSPVFAPLVKAIGGLIH